MPGGETVVLGGTFDRLHSGHEALLETAFRNGREISIGLTTDRYLLSHPKPESRRIAAYASRRRALRRWLRSRHPSGCWTIVPLADRLGRSVEIPKGTLVVSAGTMKGAAAVNRERRRRGLRALRVVPVPLLLADDLLPISSRRIRAGEIDRDGGRRTRIEVGVAVEDPADRAGVVRGIRRAFLHARIRWTILRPTGEPAQDRSRHAARQAMAGNDLGLGLAGRGASQGRFLTLRAAGVELDPLSIGVRGPALAEAVFHRLHPKA